NPRPQPWEGCALPTELFSRIIYGAKIQQNLIPTNFYSLYFAKENQTLQHQYLYSFTWKQFHQVV
uniref:hypothetical protein n=1 Tax=uncultured Capnocytophaga sp. TaxID=159273 RepID=UPI002594B2A1